MSHFFAYLSKMKFIQRWGLMRNTYPENIQEHSLQVALIAHGLALVRNKFFGGQVDPARVALLALYHDVGEVITGDLPTPIKYFNPKVKTAYDEVEVIAKQKLLNMLPQEFKPDYESLLLRTEEDPLWQLVKAADKICAYLKCVEELKVGNQEFAKAQKVIKAELDRSNLPEVAYFMEQFIPSFSLTLDELN